MEKTKRKFKNGLKELRNQALPMWEKGFEKRKIREKGETERLRGKRKMEKEERKNQKWLKEFRNQAVPM